MPSTHRTSDGIHVLDLGAGENRFTPAWMAAVHGGLDAVVADPAPLVATAGGKHFSVGLDIETVPFDSPAFPAYLTQVEALAARVLTLPVPTAAAINGHAFGAGAVLALAFDWRVMREDRGYFCLPEVDLRFPFPPGSTALIRSKLTPRATHDAMTTGRRYGGPDALTAGIVDHLCSEADLLATAVGIVAGQADKDPATLGRIKATIYASAAAALTRHA